MSFCIGVKIQARNEYFINPTVPTRDEVRKSNYLRRRSQLSSEGFHSKIWKPYISIGHPIELDKKLEIKVYTNEKEPTDIVPNESLSTLEVIKSASIKKPQTEHSQRKDMEKFQQSEKKFKKEIQKSDDISFNVRVGQSFFGLLQKEKIDKINEAVEQEKMKNEINAPQYETESDDESDLVLSTEGDVSRPTTAVTRNRLKLRPFTPLYNNISSLPSRASTRPKSVYSFATQVSDSGTYDMDEASLYRQLCSLHWLLKAMVHEDAVNMPRISLSWTIRDDDNVLTSTKNKTEIKTAWDKYVSKSIVPPETTKEQGHTSKNRHLANIPPRSVQINSSQPSDHSNESDVQTNADTDDNQASLLSRPQTKMSICTTNLDNTSRASSSKMARRRLLTEMRSVCDELDKDENEYQDRRNLHLTKIRRTQIDKCRVTQSTTLLPEDCYSDKLENMFQRSRAKSAQLIDERMAEFRENVKNMSEYRMTVCSNKYNGVRPRGAFHHMLKEFRYKNGYHSFFTALDATKNKIIYADWFLAIEESLQDYLENKRIVKILSKIRQYALITVTKISSNRLLTVLKSLADWEIRHPEISASIKFLTDHVVLMPEEEYQQWFDNIL